MKRKVNGLTINYRVRVNERRNNFVLLLHGWGGNVDSLKIVEDFLVDEGFSIINLDFPGFGYSETPPEHFELKNYVEIVKEILKIENVNFVSVVAHSFGGRVAIMLASETNYVNKLVLIDSAGIKPKFSLKKWCKIKNYKLKKWCNNRLKFNFDLSKYGSDDYKSLPNNMKGVFNRIVNLDLTNLLGNINCETLLVWGEKDKSTPLYMAKIMNKKIANSKLIVYENCGHFSYIQKFDNFCKVLKNFFE